MSVKAAITISRGQAEVESAWQSFGSEIAKSGDVRFGAAPGDQGIDPSFVFTHKLALDEVSNGYETFKHKEDECVKVVLKPAA